MPIHFNPIRLRTLLKRVSFSPGTGRLECFKQNEIR